MNIELHRELLTAHAEALRAWDERHIAALRIGAEIAEQYMSDEALFDLEFLDLAQAASNGVLRVDILHSQGLVQNYFEQVRAAAHGAIREALAVPAADESSSKDAGGFAELRAKLERRLAELPEHEAAEMRRLMGLEVPAPPSPDDAKPQDTLPAEVEIIPHELPYLYDGRVVIAKVPLQVLRANGLDLQRANGRQSYRAVDGVDIEVVDEDCWLLDTFLETYLPGLFPALSSREHWETGEQLPAGPGPYGSGVRALGFSPPREEVAKSSLAERYFRHLRRPMISVPSPEVEVELCAACDAAEQRLRELALATPALAPLLLGLIEESENPAWLVRLPSESDTDRDTAVANLRARTKALRTLIDTPESSTTATLETMRAMNLSSKAVDTSIQRLREQLGEPSRPLEIAIPKNRGVEDEQKETLEADSEDMDSHALDRAREPWRAFAGDGTQVHRWLVAQLKHKNENDCDLPFDNAARRRRLAELWEAKRSLATALLVMFPPSNSRYFSGAHAGWDRYAEDYLSRNEVVGLLNDEHALIIYSHYDRFYG